MNKKGKFYDIFGRVVGEGLEVYGDNYIAYGFY